MKQWQQQAACKMFCTWQPGLPRCPYVLSVVAADAKQTTWLVHAAAGNLEEGYIVTTAFMQDMLQRFKDQKLIHRRYAFAIIIQVTMSIRCHRKWVVVAQPGGTGRWNEMPLCHTHTHIWHYIICASRNG